MAYIKKKSERKFKITVCNGYKVNGQKRMKAQTITVPSSVPKRGIQQYVMAEAERIEKKFKYGVEESDQTHFEQYAENWLKRQEPFFKATTYAGYKRNLDIVYPLIGGIPLAKLLPMTLEEMCEELRKRPGRGGNCIKETTVQKYLETVSSVLEDAKKNVQHRAYLFLALHFGQLRGVVQRRTGAQPNAAVVRMNHHAVAFALGSFHKLAQLHSPAPFSPAGTAHTA